MAKSNKLEEILEPLYGVPAFHAPRDKDGKVSKEKLYELQAHIRKSAIVDLIIDLIGRDEMGLADNHKSKDSDDDYDCPVCSNRYYANKLRADLRAKAEELRK